MIEIFILTSASFQQGDRIRLNACVFFSGVFATSVVQATADRQSVASYDAQPLLRRCLTSPYSISVMFVVLASWSSQSSLGKSVLFCRVVLSQFSAPKLRRAVRVARCRRRRSIRPPRQHLRQVRDAGRDRQHIRARISHLTVLFLCAPVPAFVPPATAGRALPTAPMPTQFSPPPAAVYVRIVRISRSHSNSNSLSYR